MNVCSSTHLYHYLFNSEPDALRSFYDTVVRPLSDFPNSERWKQLEAHLPGFYEQLYQLIGYPVLQTPYTNSGVFITPIDFRKLPDTYLHKKPRFDIPIDRIDPGQAVLTYVLDDERISLPFSSENLESSAELWDEALVRAWFGVDNTKVFFYVPQVAVYQGRIQVSQANYIESVSQRIVDRGFSHQLNRIDHIFGWQVVSQ